MLIFLRPALSGRCFSCAPWVGEAVAGVADKNISKGNPPRPAGPPLRRRGIKGSPPVGECGAAGGGYSGVFVFTERLAQDSFFNPPRHLRCHPAPGGELRTERNSAPHGEGDREAVAGVADKNISKGNPPRPAGPPLRRRGIYCCGATVQPTKVIPGIWIALTGVLTSPP